MRRLFVMLIAAVACGRTQPRPVVRPWPELARMDGILVTYDPSSSRLLQDDVYEVMVRRDHASQQIFQDTAYTQQEMRIRVRCSPPPVMITTVSDTLRNAGVVVSGHHYGATVWAPVNHEHSESGWALELCRRFPHCGTLGQL